jgi:hypothetical protein
MKPWYLGTMVPWYQWYVRTYVHMYVLVPGECVRPYHVHVYVRTYVRTDPGVLQGTVTPESSRSGG